MPDGSSTATLAYSGSLLADFVGPVASDTANASAAAGSATYPTSPGFDWVTFADAHRVWGRWNTPGQWTSGAGAILDLRLLGTPGSKIFDDTGTVAATNDAFVAGAPCPAAASGAAAVQNHDDAGGWGNLPNQTYLTAAAEITSPSASGYAAAIGNHDGLCESGERCMYTPNFGAYQGDGAIDTCVFADGAVTGVTLYGYAHDGAP